MNNGAIRVRAAALLVALSLSTVAGVATFTGTAGATVENITGESAETVEIGQDTVTQELRYELRVLDEDSNEQLILDVSTATTAGSNLSISNENVSISGDGGYNVYYAGDNIDSAAEVDIRFYEGVASGDPYTPTLTITLTHNTSTVSGEQAGLQYSLSQGSTTGSVSYEFVDTTAPTLDGVSRVNDTTIDVAVSDGGSGIDPATIEASDFDLSAGTISGVDTSSISDGDASGTARINLTGPVDAETVEVSLQSDGISDMAGNTLSLGSGTATGMDGVAPTVSNVTLANDGSGTLDISFDADETLATLTVTVDGPTTDSIYTFDESAFTEQDGTYSLAATGAYNDGGGTYEAVVTDAVDAAGNNGGTTGDGSGLNDSYLFDTIDPTVSITDPVDGAVVRPQAVINGTVTDNAAVRAVNLTIRRDSDGDYWNGSGWVDSETTVPAAADDGAFDTDSEAWNRIVAGMTGGDSYTVTATATDSANNTAEADPIGYTIDTDSPSVSITDPANGSAVESQGTITGTASDDVELGSVTLTIRRDSDGDYWDGSVWHPNESTVSATADDGSFNTSSESWRYDSAAISGTGGYTVFATVTDAVGRANSSQTVGYRLVPEPSTGRTVVGSTGGEEPETEAIAAQLSRIDPSKEAEVTIEDSDGNDTNGLTVETAGVVDTIRQVTFENTEISGTLELTEYTGVPESVRRAIGDRVAKDPRETRNDIGRTDPPTDAGGIEGNNSNRGDSDAVSSELVTPGAATSVSVVSVAEISVSSRSGAEQPIDTAATVTMRVPRDELTTPANAVIVHETDDGVERLPTTVEAVADREVTLEAHTDSFSVFAVVEIEEPAPTQQPVEPGNETDLADTDSEPTGTNTVDDETPGFGLTIAVVTLIGLTLLVGRRQ
ncbi:hypothetical protein [Halohasta litorea]|uniref:PGF-CTERM sorting domain-containing protein n=1 Tax=Halohasta litorea TaxID=869891 RepID=A0ABD6D810_9EURY|nr:hypothetical protein [Halohasta litorea]